MPPALSSHGGDKLHRLCWEKSVVAHQTLLIAGRLSCGLCDRPVRIPHTTSAFSTPTTGEVGGWVGVLLPQMWAFVSGTCASLYDFAGCVASVWR